MRGLIRIKTTICNSFHTKQREYKRLIAKSGRRGQCAIMLLSVILLLQLLAPPDLIQASELLLSGQEEREASETVDISERSDDAGYSEEDACGDEEKEYITETEKNEENTVQITFHLTVPEGFEKGAFLDLMQLETGSVYRILATPSNAWFGRLFVPEGPYHVLNAGIAEDYSARYQLNKPLDFSVTAHSTKIIEVTLAGQSREADAADLKKSEVLEDKEHTLSESEETKEGTAGSNTDEEPLPWRRVGHEGCGKGSVSYFGTAQTLSDYIIEITRSGKTGEGEFRYSTDNGAHWSDIAVIKSQSLVTTDTGKSTGITVNFKTEQEESFAEGDTYTFYTDYEYAVTSQAQGKGQIRLSSIEPVRNADYQFALKITETGANGEAMFSYALDNRSFSEPQRIPENEAYPIPDTVLKVDFYDKHGHFVVGDLYTATIEGIHEKKDYTLLIAAACGVLTLILSVLILYFQKLRENPQDYVLNVYERIKLP